MLVTRSQENLALFLGVDLGGEKCIELVEGGGLFGGAEDYYF
jgi:hypothetical protein